VGHRDDEIAAAMLREHTPKRRHLNRQIILADNQATPDVADDLIARDRPVAAGDKILKDIKRTGMQCHRLSVGQQGASGQIHAEAAEGDRAVNVLHGSPTIGGNFLGADAENATGKATCQRGEWLRLIQGAHESPPNQTQGQSNNLLFQNN
jgi:hypothetical protein